MVAPNSLDRTQLRVAPVLEAYRRGGLSAPPHVSALADGVHEDGQVTRRTDAHMEDEMERERRTGRACPDERKVSEVDEVQIVCLNPEPVHEVAVEDRSAWSRDEREGSLDRGCNPEIACRVNRDVEHSVFDRHFQSAAGDY